MHETYSKMTDCKIIFLALRCFLWLSISSIFMKTTLSASCAGIQNCPKIHAISYGWEWLCRQ